MNAVEAQASASGAPAPVTAPSVPDEALRAHPAETTIGGLRVPLRFCRTSDGAHIAYAVVGPAEHGTGAPKRAAKTRRRMKPAWATTTPLVMLPALGMLKEDWGAFAFELSKTRLCVLPDWRGLGDSLQPGQPVPIHDGRLVPSCEVSDPLDVSPEMEDFYESKRSTKLPRLATDVCEVLRDLFWSRSDPYGGKQWKRFNLLGLGMGGIVAQTMSLVIMPSSPLEDAQFTSAFDPDDPRGEGLGIEHLVLLGTSARANNQGYGGGVFEALSKGDMGVAGQLMAHGADKPGVGDIWRAGRRPRIVIEKQFLSITSFDYIDDNPLLGLFSLPTLVLHGQQDTQVPYLEGFLIHKRIRGSAWKRMEAGHWMVGSRFGGHMLRALKGRLPASTLARPGRRRCAMWRRSFLTSGTASPSSDGLLPREDPETKKSALWSP
ncbi:Alpha/Beta hydrolase protein [Hyaloraphidium curvatum]|nr:Alpha/Beta hydrolase protein [Hyaloraphidium curvatum]